MFHNDFRDYKQSWKIFKNSKRISLKPSLNIRVSTNRRGFDQNRNFLQKTLFANFLRRSVFT